MIFRNHLFKKCTCNSVSPVVIITTTLPSMEEAKSIASALLQNRFAACVNIIGPILSLYKWKDKLEEDQEYKLFIKTERRYWKKIKDFLTKNHSYSVPEINLLSVEVASETYQKWLADGLSK